MSLYFCETYSTLPKTAIHTAKLAAIAATTSRAFDNHLFVLAGKFVLSLAISKTSDKVVLSRKAKRQNQFCNNPH